MRSLLDTDQVDCDTVCIETWVSIKRIDVRKSYELRGFDFSESFNH